MLSDIGAGAVKTGMLANAAIVHGRRGGAARRRRREPRRRSGDGFDGRHRLLEAAGVEALVRELLPLALVVTPNINEAKALSGARSASWDDARTAAEAIVEPRRAIGRDHGR